MILKTQKDAAMMAVEMEKRAIHVYERVLLLSLPDTVEQAVRSFLHDECSHLERFYELYEQYMDQQGRDRMLIQSIAADVLLPGGVMEMERVDALTNIKALYEYAAQSEADAVHAYTTFAKNCTDPETAAVFHAIADEESRHLVELENKKALLDA